jgi:hypothetical protein
MMDKLASPEQSVTLVRSMKESHREAERMRDVMLLLQHLSEQEETTIKMILDCLYDVASINLINQKFQNRQLNRFLKAIAWMPKPAFRIFALRWFKKNCPQIITRWLHNKVSFKPTTPPPSQVAHEIAAAQQSSTPAITSTVAPDIAETDASVDALAIVAKVNLAVADRDRQIQQLRTQVRVLTGLLVGVIVILGGALVLPNHSSGTGLMAPQERSSLGH